MANDLNRILQMQHTLSLPYTWNRWKISPGWFRDRVIAVEYYAGPNGGWEIHEAIKAGATWDGKHDDEYTMSMILDCPEGTMATEYDFGAGFFLRPAQPGSWFFGDEATTRKVNGTGLVHTLQIFFRKAWLHEQMSRILGRQIGSLELLISKAWQDPIVENSLKHLMALCRQGKQHDSGHITDCLVMRLLSLAEYRIESLHDGDKLIPSSIKRVIEFIHSNRDHKLTREELAQIAGVEAHYFSRLFRQTVGVTPKRYVLNSRIDLAKEMLRRNSSDLTIEQIAIQCGFYDHAHLNLEFRRIVGTTPKVYRNHG